MSVILEHVSKAYGRQKALDDIGFRLEEGEICGFLGPNGAGKSTTMKIITGCLNDYQGEVRIKEMNLRENPLKIKAIIGYLPEQNPLYPDLYIREYLLHVARLYRVGRPVAKVNAIIERTGLEPEIQKIKELVNKDENKNINYITLVAMYQGMRLKEITQLKKEDTLKVSGIEIKQLGERNVKSAKRQQGSLW
jgi:ABC-2 type transport system ATP-binding protein